jgi:hypothetical protein
MKKTCQFVNDDGHCQDVAVMKVDGYFYCLPYGEYQERVEAAIRYRDEQGREGKYRGKN